MNVKKDEILCMTFNVYQQVRKAKLNGKTMFKPYRHHFSKYFRRYRGEDLNGKSLLIWRTGGIGDIIVIQSVVKQLKERFPNVSITFSTIEKNMPILASWDKGLIDRVTTLPFSLDVLKDHDYHMTFEGIIERCKEAEKENCYDIYNRVASQKYDPDKYNPTIKSDHILDKTIERLSIPEKTVALQTRASSILRTMPPEIMIDIINILHEKGYNVGIIDSQLYSSSIDKLISAMIIDKQRMVNLSSASKTILHGVSLMNKCIGAICIDSAFSHIAAALGKPVVTVYGPFKGKVRMKYYKNVDLVEPEDDWNDCGKYPCFFHDDRLSQCPYIERKERPGCMLSIKAKDVVEKFINLLEKENVS